MSKKAKGRGVAARQAQLRNRKSKGKVRHQNFDPGPSATISNVTKREIEPAVATESVGDKDKSLSAKRDSGHSRNRRSVRSTKEVALSYDYLGMELKQIGILTALIGVVLAVLTILLG